MRTFTTPLVGLLAATSLALSTPAWAQQFALEAGKGLHWQNGQAQNLASLPVRAKRWDQRQLPDGSRVALVLDGDRAELLLARAQGERMSWVARHPAPPFEVERVCLHLDAQGLLHAFLLGTEGLSAQWLLSEGKALPEREFATPMEPSHCEVRDAEARLYISEPGVGLWSYAADAELPQRELLLHAPQLDEKQLHARLGEWLAQNPVKPLATLATVGATAQTAVVKNPGDAADDPAIWLNPKQPQHSRVLGTDKKRGLAVYDLQGRERQFLAVGRINNVDLRQGLKYGGKPIDLAVATQRDEAGLVLFEIQPTGRVRELARLPTSLNDIYGICVGRNSAGQLDIFPNDKDGRVQQIRLHRDGGAWRGERLREVQLASQPEGCVVDEARQQLFVGEEKHGIWRVALAGDGPLQPVLAVAAGGALVPDVEGLALFHGNALHNKRYLLVSSQGNDSFVLYDADPPHALRGAFRIGINAALGLDAVSETDGLELSAANFGGPYRDGLMVVQDGHKRLPQGTQNFKLVPWKAVLEKLGLLR